MENVNEKGAIEVLIKIWIFQYTSLCKFIKFISSTFAFTIYRVYFGMMSKLKEIITFSLSQIFTETFTTPNHELFLLA